MKFQPGHSGNPAGRPKGALNKQSKMATLLESRSEDIINKMIDLALEGDTVALRLCIERLLPKAQPTPVTVELPNYAEPNNLESITEILNQIFAGNLDPIVGKKCIDLIETHDKRYNRLKPFELF